jgi:FlaA1/EpsC-like NDP-sugar epimerase
MANASPIVASDGALAVGERGSSSNLLVASVADRNPHSVIARALGALARVSASPRLRAARARRALRIGLDVAIVAGSLALAFTVRYESLDPRAWGELFLATLPAALVVRLGLLHAAGLGVASWRAFATRDGERLGLAIGAGSLAMLAVRLAAPTLAVPIGVIGLEGLFTLLGCWLIRSLARATEEAAIAAATRTARRTTRALLVGADRDGRIAADALASSPGGEYEVVGFVDDASDRQRERIAGVPVLGTLADVADVVQRTAADVVILAMPRASREARRRAVESCRSAGVPLRTVPAYWELLGGKLEVAAIRQVRIEDLLGREVVTTSPEAALRLSDAYRGKRILVTGAGGSIGSELCRQLAGLEPAELVMLEYSENNLFDIDAEIRPRLGDAAVAALVDIRDAAALGRLFARRRPQVVFHAAAYKHVPMMEAHASDAVANNVRGTRMVVEAAQAHGAERFVLVSTDKAVNPTNVMGATKRTGEMIVQSRARTGSTKMCCVRFGNVLGSRGSVLHTFRRQIEAGGPVTVTHPDMTRFFMTIPEAVRLVMQAGSAADSGEIFVLDMGDPVRIVDMAKQMIELSANADADVGIEFCGLRPGEKLYEELAHAADDLQPSGIVGVNVVRPSAQAKPTIMPWLERLEAAALQRDDAQVRRLLALGTGYKPTGALAEADLGGIVDGHDAAANESDATAPTAISAVVGPAKRAS